MAQALFPSDEVLISPGAMAAAAAHVEREYGGYGYRLGVSPRVALRRVAVFEVAHSDGSRFNLVADEWGNVRRIPDELGQDQALEFVLAMSREACTV